jgi:hypothetical protein
LKKIDLQKAVEERDRLIVHLLGVIGKISPEQCQSVLKTGFYCMMPATHYYGGVALCQSCADQMIENGANPPPFPIPIQRISSKQAGAISA